MMSYESTIDVVIHAILSDGDLHVMEAPKTRSKLSGCFIAADDGPRVKLVAGRSGRDDQ
jgi:hypothetical protein